MGYGIIEIINNKPNLITLNSISLNKLEDHFLKLKSIFEQTILLIDKYNPDELAIESQFFGKNVQSMLKLGRAQGVAISAALSRSIPIFEYAPRKIKMAITGNGAASKEQVAAFLKGYLQIKEIPEKLDATDGLAVAVCHFFQDNALVNDKPIKNWSDFIKKNPDRIK